MITKNQSLSVRLFSYVGTLLEYFDYILFMELSYFISKIFFPENMSSYLYIFSVGYGARFLGVLLFSLTKKESMKLIQHSIFLMSFATLTIGLIPGYKSIGIAATYAFIFMRFLQSISYAIEFPMALRLQSSQSPDHEEISDNIDDSQLQQNVKTSNVGLLISSATLGNILACLCAVILVKYFSTDQIIKFAWRIPFILSGIIGILLVKQRMKNVKSVNFTSASDNKFGILHNMRIIFNSLQALLFPCSLIVIFLYFPVFFQKIGYTNLYFTYKYKLIMLVLSIVFMTIFSKLIDKNKFDIIKIQKLFVLVWTSCLLLATTHKLGMILLMLFTQLSLAFAMPMSMKYLLNKSANSAILTALTYNLGMFIASIIASIATINVASMLIIPLILSILFTHCHKKTVCN